MVLHVGPLRTIAPWAHHNSFTNNKHFTFRLIIYEQWQFDGNIFNSQQLKHQTKGLQIIKVKQKGISLGLHFSTHALRSLGIKSSLQSVVSIAEAPASVSLRFAAYQIKIN